MSNNILDGLHCLIVDDDPVFLPVLQAMLTDLGIGQVTTAQNGAEVIALLDTSPRFDVVLCDMWMPSGNGLQVLKAIRTGQVKSVRLDMCFIMMSGLPLPEPIRIASSLDACGYLLKPFSPEKLRAAIVKARDKHFPVDPARYAQIAVPLGACA